MTEITRMQTLLSQSRAVMYGIATFMCANFEPERQQAICIRMYWTALQLFSNLKVLSETARQVIVSAGYN